MPVETERYSDVAYQIIASVCQTHGCRKRIVYGIKAEYPGEAAEVLRIRDISINKSDILRLIMQLYGCGVTKEHLMSVIEDFVQELNS